MTDKQDPARNGTPDGTRAIAYGPAGATSGDDGSNGAPDFLADLARAMQAAASTQRKHIADVAEERKKAHVDGVHAREATEKQELREVADRDVKGIEGWASAEIERIRLERQRRIAARKTELENQLEQHHSMIESEIGAVEAAVVAYQAEVDSFFARLDVQSDPIAIAETARNLPTFPALETIGRDNGESGSLNGSAAHSAEPAQEQVQPIDEHVEATLQSAGDAGEPGREEGQSAKAETSAGAREDLTSGEPVAVGQADATTPDQTPVVAAATHRAPSPIAAAVTPWEGPGEATDGSASDDPRVGTGPKITPRSSGAVIQSVPSLRPIGSWLRRTTNSGSDDTTD